MTCSSPHFSRRELRSRDGSCEMDPHFLHLLEHYREALGRPAWLSSAYRSPADNRRVNGVARSQHLYGRAVDLAPQSRAGLDWVLRLALFSGLGVKDGKVLHLDARHLNPSTNHTGATPAAPTVWFY